ncbi:LacI family transcriptional regulator [Thermosipho africanus Ob7]|jgi:LacI family transcriptional regulator|uniref:LacI family DNA-binding transcriptional regulator n=1 Tax=Thermosipho africanus TaxID=2421 RepID=UPI000E0AE51D|nr:LacI family DNA-binding transcriptional regulator [Thermosipho africanus]RDI90876.1 LacI family transcriptional regulator [Thermosipho africanus Ob7]
MKRFVTLKDIARESGYSVITVSRALNNKGYVSKEAKEKILQVAKKLNYVKNITATSLKYNKTKTIGVVIVDTQNPFYSDILKGVEYAARKKDYQILFMNTDRKYEIEEKAIRTFLERRVDGLIITAMQTKIEDLKFLQEINFPTVLVEYHNEDLNIDEVYIDDLKGGYLATKHLIESGKKNILFFAGSSFKYATRKRCEGYKKAILEHGLNENTLFSKEGFEEAFSTFKQFWKRKNVKIDGIFCYNDIFALAVLKFFNEEGIKVPQDVAVIGYDDIVFSSIVGLSTVKVDKFAIGEKAFEILHQRINKKRHKKKEYVFDVELVKRKTT